MKLLTFITLLLPFYAWGNSAPMQGFCFSIDTSLSRVESYVQPLLLPKDNVIKREQINCIEISLSPSRKDLIKTYLERRYRIVRTYSETGASSDPHSKEMCRISVLKHINKERVDTTIGAKTKKPYGVLNQSRTSSIEKQTSQLLMSSGKQASLMIDETTLYVTCRYLNSNRYELTFSLYSEGTGLSSSAYLTRDEPLEVGSIVDELNSKNRNLDINKGATWEKSKGVRKTDIWLSVY